MRPHQIFSAMSQPDSDRVMKRIAEESPDVFRQTVAAAAAALKFRPQYLQKQPIEKRLSAIRRSMARPAASPLAEELFAIYFLKCRLELLAGWLELLGLAHEDGVLTDDEIVCPEQAELEKKVAEFRAKKDEDGELLLQVFAGQTAIEWPALDALVEGGAS